jgi:hypothetical protein
VGGFAVAVVVGTVPNDRPVGRAAKVQWPMAMTEAAGGDGDSRLWIISLIATVDMLGVDDFPPLCC